MPYPTVSAAAMRVMKLLVGNPPQTVSDLVDASGVTRTAVTEQLNELLAAGLVEREVERSSGRGRSRHVYTATRVSLTALFSSDQHLVVPAIWRAIDAIGGERLTKRVLRRVSRSLADHYKQRITAKRPENRLKQFTELLCSEGVLADTGQQKGKVVLRKRSCPFIGMLDENHMICAVGLEMIAQIVGSRVRRTACRYEGDPCCVFEIVDKR